MNFRALVGLAFSYLWQRKLRTTLTILGVVIGVGALTCLVGFGLGLKRLFEEQTQLDDLMSIIIVYSTDESTVDVAGGGPRKERTPLDRNTLAKIREIPGVAEAHPDVNFTGTAKYGATTEPVFAVSMPPYADYTPVKKLLRAGDVFSADDAREVIISEYLHKVLVKESGLVSLLGKTITLIYHRDPHYAPLGEDGEPMVKGSLELKVVGVLAETRHEKKRIGLYLVHSRLVIIPAELATHLWDVEGLAGGRQRLIFDEGPSRTYDQIMVRVKSSRAAPRIKQGLEELDVDFLYIPDALAAQKFFMWVFTIILGIIGGISLVVASIGIINTLVMSILERTREIGIMRAVGASNGEIMKLVMLEGASIGFMGGLLGFGLGYLAGQIIGAAMSAGLASAGGGEETSLFYFPTYFFLFTVGFATFLSWISSLYPAWRAIRVDPVAALRRE